MFLGLDLSSWNNLMLVSLGLAAFAAVAVVATTRIVITLQDEEAAARAGEFAAYRIEAGKEIARANQGAAEATERAAALEKEAAEARQQTEKIKAVVAWRFLSDATISALTAALSKKPGAINLRYTDGDPEALYLSIQLSAVFAKAGWSVAPGSLKLSTGIVFGIFVPDDPTTDASALKTALSAASVLFTSGPLDMSGAGFNMATIAGAPTLMVGSRLPAKP